MINDDDKLIFMTDSYKYSHANVINDDVVNVYSYLESRGGKFNEILFFGLQYYLKKYLAGVVVTMEDVYEAAEFCKQHFGRDDVFDMEGWTEIVVKHGGRLPLHIKAVPEGTIVSSKNVIMSIVNTGGKKTRFLTNFVETLLMKVWYPITIASRSYRIKQGIRERLLKTGGIEGLDFKCHDFGYRGVPVEEAAKLGGAAHLVSFKGTDTVAGIRMLQRYYNEPMAGFTIPATEHSIICSYGNEGEVDACRAFLKKYPTGTIACVSDTRNIYNCVENIWGGVLFEEVSTRNGTLVVRPDSGDYFEVVPRILEILWEKFGGHVNEQGYKVLDSHVRVIQGDGMNEESILDLHDHINHLGWSSANLAVGSGGGLLVEDATRDTHKFAIKASAINIDEFIERWIGIKKTPITDIGKESKQGRFKLIRKDDGYKTVDIDAEGEDIMETVFYNGSLTKEISLAEIREKLQLTKPAYAA